MHVSDIGSRVDAGQQFAVAERAGEWTAIWYLGQKGWFHNPPGARNALWATGWVATPKQGRDSIPVYGRAYPEAEAYPEGVPPQAIVPLQYQLLAGQRYAVGLVAATEYYRAVTFDPTNHVVVRGDLPLLPDPVRPPHRLRPVRRRGHHAVPDRSAVARK